jgi:4a-hydroxytetrahydrobiopterin dehydratase
MALDQSRDNEDVPGVLSDADLASGLAGLPGWERDGDTIVKSYTLPSFPDAIAFVVRIGFFAEKADHHPDLDIRWRTVRVALSTHSEGGITEKDLSLAREVESVAGGS